MYKVNPKHTGFLTRTSDTSVRSIILVAKCPSENVRSWTLGTEENKEYITHDEVSPAMQINEASK